MPNIRRTASHWLSESVAGLFRRYIHFRLGDGFVNAPFPGGTVLAGRDVLAAARLHDGVQILSDRVSRWI